MKHINLISRVVTRKSMFTFRWEQKLKRSRRVATLLMTLICEGKEEINRNFYHRRGCMCWMQLRLWRCKARTRARPAANFSGVLPLTAIPNAAPALLWCSYATRSISRISKHAAVFLLLLRSGRNNNNTTSDREIFHSRDNADHYRQGYSPLWSQGSQTWSRRDRI